MITSLKALRLLALMSGVCILLGMPFTSVHTQQRDPIAKEGLLRSLTNKALSSKELIEQVEQRGVSFKLTSTDEQEIRREGKYLGKKGLDDLIAAVRKYYRPTETETHGELLPAQDPNPPNPCGEAPPQNALILFLGNSVAYATAFPYAVITLGDEVVLSISKNENGLSITAKIRSADGRIVAGIIKNEFRINPNNYWYMERPDRHTLIVHDQLGRTVLNIRYLNQSTVKILGIFDYPNTPRAPVIITEEEQLVGHGSFSRFCFGDNMMGAIKM